MVVVVDLIQSLSLFRLLLRPWLGWLSGRSTILLILLWWRVRISNRRTRILLAMPRRTATLRSTWSRRHARRAQRLMIHVAWRGPLLLSLSNIDRRYLRSALRRLPPFWLGLRQHTLRLPLSRPVLGMTLLHRTTVGGSTHLILRLRGLLRRRLQLGRVLYSVEAEWLVVQRRPRKSLLACGSGCLSVIAVVSTRARPCHAAGCRRSRGLVPSTRVGSIGGGATFVLVFISRESWKSVILSERFRP